jgi:hypothetical protein
LATDLDLDSDIAIPQALVTYRDPGPDSHYAIGLGFWINEEGSDFGRVAEQRSRNSHMPGVDVGNGAREKLRFGSRRLRITGRF